MDENYLHLVATLLDEENNVNLDRKFTEDNYCK